MDESASSTSNNDVVETTGYSKDIFNKAFYGEVSNILKHIFLIPVSLSTV